MIAGDGPTRAWILWALYLANQEAARNEMGTVGFVWTSSIYRT
jgi:hypothetical protein